MTVSKDDVNKENVEKYLCSKCEYNHSFGSNRFDPHWEFAEDDSFEFKKDVENVRDDVDEEDTLSREEIEEAEEEDYNVPALYEIRGIDIQLANQLKALGIFKPMDLASLTPKGLSDLLHDADYKGVGKKTAEKIINEAKNACGNGTETAMDALKQFNIRIKPQNVILTGCPELDERIGGGWLLGTTVEIYGEGRTGKSELALQAAVNAFLPSEVGGIWNDDFDFQVLVIDTEGVIGTAVSRLPTMCRGNGERLGWNDEQIQEYTERVLNNIDLKRKVYSSKVQQAHALNAYQTAMNGERNYIMVIVDSLVNNFRVDFDGGDKHARSVLADRQRAINRHIKTLKDIITLGITPSDLGGILMCTNQAQHKPTMFGDGLTNIGGNVVKHHLDTRLELRKSKGNLRRAKLIDSSFMPGGEAIFSINTWGIGGESSESSVEKYKE